MARGSIEIRYDRRKFHVTGATNLPDRKGVAQGDRVQVVLVCMVRELVPKAAKDGKWDLDAALEATEGRIVKILDRQPPRKPRAPKGSV
jgi:hypothetical protein